jgi:hypothetical protein
VPIQLVGQIRTNLRYDVVVLGVLLRLSGFFGLPATVRTLLLRLVMRVRFLVVVAAFPTEKEQNLLRVAGTHTDSLRRWRMFVKRTTLSTLKTENG